MPKVYEKIPFTDDEINHFNQCGKFHEFALSDVWKAQVEYMDKLSEEALKDLRGCLASNEVKGQLTTRWQQRDSVVKAIKDFVNGKSEEYQFMREQLTKQEEEEWQQQ